MLRSSERHQLSKQPEFNLEVFCLKWQKARLSALQIAFSSYEHLSVEQLSKIELECLAAVPEELQSQVLRRVFDCSRKLGLSLSKYFNLSLEISDFAELASLAKIPCFYGKWNKHNEALVLERKGCSELSLFKSFGCDYWREALDGFVMGAGETERLARHRSQGHGDSECVDVLFNENYALPRVISSVARLKYGAVPDSYLKGIEEIANDYYKMKINFYADGYSEGVLYYRLESDEGVLCGAGGQLLHEVIIKRFKDRFPHLKLQDSSPLAVYGGAT